MGGTGGLEPALPTSDTMDRYGQEVAASTVPGVPANQRRSRIGHRRHPEASVMWTERGRRCPLRTSNAALPRVILKRGLDSIWWSPWYRGVQVGDRPRLSSEPSSRRFRPEASGFRRRLRQGFHASGVQRSCVDSRGSADFGSDSRHQPRQGTRFHAPPAGQGDCDHQRRSAVSGQRELAREARRTG